MKVNQADMRGVTVKILTTEGRTVTLGAARKPGVVMASSKEAMKSHHDIVESTAATIYRHRKELFGET